MSFFRRIGDFFDDRIAHRNFLDALLRMPIVGGARWTYALGGTLAFLFVVELVTGLALMTSYVPSTQGAWASVVFLTHVTRGGWLVRGVHAYAAQALVVLSAAHLLQVALAGGYRRPREVTWWIGLALVGLVLSFSLTGNPLRWDQRGFWAMRVETGIAGATPLVGADAQAFLLGGAAEGQLTLTRFYSWHVALLPLVGMALAVWHVALVRKHGLAPPPATRENDAKTEPFFPGQTARDVIAATLVLAVLAWLTFRAHGAPIDAPADPASEYPARPEWYFAPLYQLRKYFPGSSETVATLVLPGLFVGYLAALPFLDRHPAAPVTARVRALAPLFAGMIGVVLLTYLSIRADAADAPFQKARAAADQRAAVALKLAEKGVPASGPLDMLKNDPELRGEAIFKEKCASCHVLGDLGDRKKHSAPVLDGWGTKDWILQMLHDPDSDSHFGKTPYAGEMPSMDTPPKDNPAQKMMSKEDMEAAATFLSAQGADPSENRPDEAAVQAGEKIVTTRCTSCHLYKGEGDDSDEGLAPELAGYGSEAWVIAQITNPATKTTYREQALDPSRKGHMPKFEGELSAADIAIVAKWTRAHARAGKPAP